MTASVTSAPECECGGHGATVLDCASTLVRQNAVLGMITEKVCDSTAANMPSPARTAASHQICRDHRKGEHERHRSKDDAGAAVAGQQMMSWKRAGPVARRPRRLLRGSTDASMPCVHVQCGTTAKLYAAACEAGRPFQRPAVPRIKPVETASAARSRML